MENKKTASVNEEVIRNRRYNEVVAVVEAKVVSKNKRTYAVLVDQDDNDYRFELVKESISLENKGGLKVEDHKVEPVAASEAVGYVPDIFIEIATQLKKEKPLNVHLTFSETTYIRENQETTFRSMYRGDVDTIYCPSIHKTTEFLDKQLERKAKAEMNKKGKEISL